MGVQGRVRALMMLFLLELVLFILVVILCGEFRRSALSTVRGEAHGAVWELWLTEKQGLSLCLGVGV